MELSQLGTIRSRAMARLMREEAMMLAFAEDNVASNPARITATAPGLPRMVRAAVVKGSLTSAMVDCSNIPPITKTMMTYRTVTNATEPMRARGRFLDGSLISSATAAILTNPKKETNTRAVVAEIESKPN